MKIQSLAEAENTLDQLVERHGLDLDLSVEVSNMKRAAGKFHSESQKIKISKHLLENYPEKVPGTLKHELGHAIVDRRYRNVKPHGREWQKVMEKLGVENPSACHELQLADYSYMIRCTDPECDVEFGRYRKSKIVKHAEKYRCGECGSKLESFEV